MKKSCSLGLYKTKKQSSLDIYFSLNDIYKKKNEQLLNFIKTNSGNINILNIYKFKSNYNIKIQSNSLVNILNKINDKLLLFQDFIKFIIISEKKDTISLELDECYDKYINLINNHETFDIIIKKINEYNKNKIKISQKSLLKIFKNLNIRSWEEVFNYIEIMIYEEDVSYHFEEYENMGELIYSIYNNIFGENNFYIYKKNNNIISPITNYSIKKIFNMLIKDKKSDNINNNINNKYCIVKLKDENVLLYEENNKKILDKLLIKNDFKFLYNKYHEDGEMDNKWKITKKEKSLIRQKKPDIIVFNNYLISAEKTLNETLKKIKKIKNELTQKILNENNYFIQIKDINNNIKYINIQYINLVYKNSLYYNQKDKDYIFSFNSPDYIGEKISISINRNQINDYISKPILDKYICILNNKNKYLVKVDNLQKILKNMKTLNKKYKFDIFPPSEQIKDFSLDEINIDEQQKVKTIEVKLYKKKKIENNDNQIKYIKKNNNNLEIKGMDSLLKKIAIDKKLKSRNNEENKSNISYREPRTERSGSETLNHDTIDSENRVNKSMYLINSFNTLPEKDFYIIRRVVKIIKKDKKKKDKKDKKEKK